MNRRRLMLGEDRWAKEPLVIFDLSSGPVFGNVKMNGAYFLPIPVFPDKPVSPDKKDNTFYGGNGYYSLGHQDSIFLEDVTKYRKFVVTAKWKKIPEEETATIGFLNKKEDGEFGSTFGLHMDVRPSSSQRTYTFDIKNLEGLQKFSMRCNYVFIDDEGDSSYSTFQIIKMVLE